MRKLVFVYTLILLVLASAAIPVSALDRDYSYTYNTYDEATTVSNPYYIKKSVAGLGLNTPRDVKVYNDEIYILDSGNNRIVVLNKDYTYLKEIILTYADGKKFDAKELTGIFISSSTIYTVDRTNECIVKSDTNGNIIKVFYCPEKIKEKGDVSFIPTKCVVDGAGYIYILLENEYRGFMVLDAEGNFSTYYGSAKVTVTAQVLKNTLWRSFMTEEQISKTSQYVPGGYADVEIDENGFIYAARGVSDSTKETVCKLNSSGDNVLIYKDTFGDYDLLENNSTQFISVTVDDNGFIAALDKTGKKIFRYTPEGYLMYIFGGEGDGKGLFKNPCEICCFNSDILVLDSDTAKITVFAQEELTAVIDKAQILYSSARFSEAKDMWNTVLKQADNYELALVGLGKVYEAEKNYPSAMDYYKAGGSKTNYSSAFTKQRSLVVKKYFTPVFLLLVIALAVFSVIRKRRLKAGKIQKKDYEHGTKLQYIRYAVLHPFDGFSEMRYNKKENPLYAAVIAGIWFLAKCLNYNYNGYIFNSENPEQFNVWIILFSTVGIILLFVLCEWLLATFFEGKGTFSQLICGGCYSLIPMIIGCLAQLILSNVLTIDETFFVTAIKLICTLWSLFLIFIAMKQVNQYSYIKNAVVVFCSVLGVLAVVFLVVLFFNLWVQLSDFCATVIQEISCRIEAM